MHHVRPLLGLIIVILALVSLTSIYVSASTIYPMIILPPPQLYSIISTNRLLQEYKPLYKAVVEGNNYIIDNETGYVAIGKDGYIKLSYPQPRPMVMIEIPESIAMNTSSLESLEFQVNFTREPSTWSLYINFTGDNVILIYVRGLDKSSNKEYLTDTATLHVRVERIEVAYVPGILYMYVKLSNDNFFFYYPMPDDSLVDSMVLKGAGVFKGRIYQVMLLSKGSEIIIPALEQTLAGGVTYHITKSNAAYLVLYPYKVDIEFVRPPTIGVPSYKKKLLSVIDFPFATGILTAYLEPSLNGMMIGVNASFYHLTDLNQLLDDLYYYVKYFVLEYDVQGVVVVGNQTMQYDLGTYTLKITGKKQDITIPVSEKFQEYIVTLTLYIPGALSGDPFTARQVPLGSYRLNDYWVPELNVSINEPSIYGNINLKLINITKPSHPVNPCLTCENEETYKKAIVSVVEINKMVDVQAYLDKYFPYLTHYYLVTKVNVGGNEYSYEKPINGMNISYEFQVPLNNSYTITFSIKAPGIVMGSEDIRSIVEEKISSFNIKLVSIEPQVVIDLPFIVNLVAKSIPGIVHVEVPVKVYWTPTEKVLLMTPTIYKAYLVNPFTGQEELIFSATSRWLSDTTLELDVPITMNVHDLVVEVQYFLGNRWVTASKRVTLNISLPPTPPNITNTTIPVNMTNTTATNTTFTTVTACNCTNVTVTSVVTIANTTIVQTVWKANTTIVKVSTVTQNVTTTVINNTTITTTTTVVSPVTVFATITTTYTPELPVVLVNPPYSYGIGALVAAVVAAISLRYLNKIIGRVRRR